MKRLSALTVGLLLLIISACAPPAIEVRDYVLPTLISATVARDDSRTVVLQGRYFGDGASGQAENSYVILGANISGEGGVAVRADEWSASRIVVTAPQEAKSGFVFVVVGGVRSNALTANLP